MSMTNAEKQQRWRDRNLVVLTDSALDIAEKLIEMDDQAKLRKVTAFLNDHLRNPNRTRTLVFPDRQCVILARQQVAEIIAHN
jgi:predicted secreted protein